MQVNTISRITSDVDLRSLYQTLIATRDPARRRIRICMTGCRAFGALQVRDAIVAELQNRGLSDQVDVVETGCHGFCARAPVAVIEPEEIFYQQIKPEDAGEIVEETLVKGETIERLIFRDQEGTPHVFCHDVPFYNRQHKVVLRNCGYIDPTRIQDYILREGYQGIAKAITTMSPEEVIDTVKRSGLRGRGGAGFPTGMKWAFARQAAGEPKFIVCNADEGDPGAFMDRGVLEGDPHSVLEGMMIAAYAIGGSQGFVYVRAEYPIAVKHVRIAIEQARNLGLLGKNILGSSFSFDIDIREGAGAFVCGEETALLASIEGKRGMPRARPPFPAQSGLFGKPTVINNVETLANLPPILLHGADEFAALGTEKSKGTKIFALAGKVNNTGLVEVPIGTALQEVVFGVGGGIPGGRKFKAVQIGGPSGGCVPATHIDLPVDYEALTSIGSMMGSGGMIVLDEDTCIVDVARYFLNFVQNESCGKCTPCRLGTLRMLETLNRITEGKGSVADLGKLEMMGRAVKDASLCGLGQTAPNPVLSTLSFFRDEYEAHVLEKRCPALVCKALLTYEIDLEACTGCGICARNCPVQAINKMDDQKKYTVDLVKCVRCGVCFDLCKFDSVIKKSEGICATNL